MPGSESLPACYSRATHGLPTGSAVPAGSLPKAKPKCLHAESGFSAFRGADQIISLTGPRPGKRSESEIWQAALLPSGGKSPEAKCAPLSLPLSFRFRAMSMSANALKSLGKTFRQRNLPLARGVLRFAFGNDSILYT